MNIYLRELKAHRKSVVLWSLFIFVFVIMGMQKYASMNAAGAEEFIKIMDELPKSIKAAFGMNKLDVTTLMGYYSVLYIYIVLMMGIQSSMLGSNIISKEEKEKTSEFLMTKPITRKQVLISKILAGSTIIIFLNILLFASSLFILSYLDGDLSLYKLLLLNIGLLFIQLLFMVLGVLISSFKAKKSTNYTMMALIFTYFLSIIIDIWDKLKVLSIFTPFKYFDSKQIIPNNSLNILYVILSIILIIIMLLISFNKYNKRDLQV